MCSCKQRVDIIEAPEDFHDLREEWIDLWSRAEGHHHESFAVCWLSWQCVARRAGRSLRIITVRSEGRLIAVWPLVRWRNRFWTVLRRLSPESADYTTVLIDPAYSSPELVNLIWRAARERCSADIITLPYLESKGELFRLASMHHGVMKAKEHPYAVARLSMETDWHRYAESLGALSGNKPGALRRRLERRGQLELRILGPEDAQENARVIDWMLDCKREWAKRTGKQGEWLFSEAYRDYLVKLANHRDSDACARLLLATLNGAPIAASMVGLGTRSITGLIAGFDPRQNRLAPGAVATEAWVRWALECGLDLDFGVGNESFKQYWSRGHGGVVCSIDIAQTPWGRVAFAAHEYREKAKSAVARLRGARAEIYPIRAGYKALSLVVGLVAKVLHDRMSELQNMGARLQGQRVGAERAAHVQKRTEI
jgi:CelD/BcsL family acetyltransferase involved in cellulose biosynthesis